jgi:hypothetical protein
LAVVADRFTGVCTGRIRAVREVAGCKVLPVGRRLWECPRPAFVSL